LLLTSAFSENYRHTPVVYPAVRQEWNNPIPGRRVGPGNWCGWWRSVASGSVPDEEWSPWPGGTGWSRWMVGDCRRPRTIPVCL